MTKQTPKPVLDEQTLEKLLEAAYVLQEHNCKMQEAEEKLESQSERLREQESASQAPRQRDNPESEETSRARGDYTLTLAEIVEAQHQIQMRHLELDKAMAVVADKVVKITGASGAAIGILEGKAVRYRAGAGAPALPAGSEVPIDEAICKANLRTGQVIRSEDVDTEFLFDPEPCRQRGILSLLVVPVYHDGEIVGSLELYFDKIHGYAEQDIHTCQLMAGLVTEAIGRDAGLTLKKSMAAERSTMLEAIERLQPNLAAWADDRRAGTAGAGTAAAATSPCWKCGSMMLAEEQFCGKCGVPRSGEGETSSMTSKLATAWHMQQKRPEASAATPPNGDLPATMETARSVAARQHEDDAGLEEGMAGDYLPEPFTFSKLQDSDPLPALSFSASTDEDAMAESVPSESLLDEDDAEAPLTTLAQPEQQDIIWSSAARARDFLESLSATRTPSALARFWRSRRGDFYLAIAVILVAVVIRWGIWSNHSVGAMGRGTAVSTSAGRRKPPAPDADLSAFDKLLIDFGLAEAPEAPEYKGNPNTQVWVDLQTALYYCPGSDLYRKTANGKLTSQREAQLDQFEPASRRACD
ncbi:MAG: GAF domain-containing protein [Candidatus Sulfotelmatobacter sp.]